jgi:hypothetical protein
VADTDTIVEERQSIAMSKVRIIFFSFNLVQCFGGRMDRRRGVVNHELGLI